MLTRRKAAAAPVATEIPASLVSTEDTAVEVALEQPIKRLRANTAPEDILLGSTPKPLNKKAKKGKKTAGDNDSTPYEVQTIAEVHGLDDYKKPGVLVLPPRLRQAHPGAIDQKRKNRTKADVDKATNEYNQLVIRIEQLKKQKDEMTAQHDLQQEKNEANEESSAIHHISQVKTKKIAYQEPEDPLDEEEEFFEIDDKDEFDGGAIDVDKVAQINIVSKPRTRKPARGETRAGIEEVKKTMKAQVAAGLGDHKNEGTKIKENRVAQRPAHLSGIQAAWASNSKSTTVHHKTPKPHLEDLPELSDDTDLFSTGPVTFKHSQVTVEQSRQNNYVAIHDSNSGSDSDSVTIPTPTQIKRSGQHLLLHATAKATKLSKLSARPAVKSEPASSSPFTTPASQRGKAKAKLPKQEQASSSSHLLTTPETELPAFINQKWLATILPTLYHCLYASEEPFASFVKGSPDFMAQITKILDRTIAYARVNKKRSSFGSNAIEVIDTFFKQPEYLNRPDLIAHYASWAVQPDGPGFFLTPTPDSCRAKEGEEGYIKPRGLFESRFIIDTIVPLFPAMEGSIGGYGEFIGALGLAAAAVERGFMLFMTGAQSEVDDAPAFSRVNVGDQVGDYIVNAKKLSPNGWSRIKAACRISSGFVTRNEVGLIRAPGLEKKRRSLFLPSSPLASDDETML